jgi:hypothetical protein
LDVGGRARASKNMKAVEGGALLWNENEKPLTVVPAAKKEVSSIRSMIPRQTGLPASRDELS